MENAFLWTSCSCDLKLLRLRNHGPNFNCLAEPKTRTVFGYLYGLLQAVSSDSNAHIYAYLPDGTFLGEVQNGGGSRYGGTVMGFVGIDPVYIAIVSTSGGSIVVPTTPFQP